MDEHESIEPSEPSRLLDSVGTSRRDFVKRVAVGTAFAAPVLSSFSMSGVNAAYAQSNGSPGDGSNTTDGGNF
ncbi:MAG: twin-arginine translocation signal domain-containing protein [Acidimicrobiales bacterium]